MAVADTYDVPTTYATLADAKTQLIADAGGANAGKVVSIRLAAATAEDHVIPTTAQYPTTAVYYLKYCSTSSTQWQITGTFEQGSGTLYLMFDGLTIYKNNGLPIIFNTATYAVWFNNMIIQVAGTGTYCLYIDNYIMQLLCVGCSFTTAAAAGVAIYTGCPGVTYLKNCLFNAATAVLGANYTGPIVAENCRAKCKIFFNSGGASTYSHGPILRHNTIYNTVEADGAATTQVMTIGRNYAYGKVIVRNNIFKNFKYLFYSTTQDFPWSFPNAIDIDRNIYSLHNTAGNFFESVTVDYATFAAWQASGFDANSSVNDALAFSSTDPTNANFLKLTAALNSSAACGVETDAFGTNRKNWLVDPGAHQFAAANYDADKTLTSAAPAGNFNAANLDTEAEWQANVKTGITGGLAGAWTGQVTPVTQAAAPTAFALTSSGDGLTHTAAITCTESDAVYEIQNASNAVVAASVASGEKLRGLTVGATYHSHTLANGKSKSDASPGAVAAAITANSADPAVILDGQHVRVDGSQIDGTSDKIYSAAEEIARNEIPTLTSIPSPDTGGPAAWLERGVSRAGTQDLDAVKLAFESARNNDNGTVAGDIVVGNSVLIRNVTIDGTYGSGSTAAAGTLYYDNTSTATTITLRYVPGDNFGGGTLHAIRLEDMNESSQAVASGNNVFTVSASKRYAFFVRAYNSGRVYGGTSNILFLAHREGSGADDFEIQWKTDYDADFTNGNYYSINSQYQHVFPNRTAHRFQWKIKGDGQNHRLVLRNVSIEARMKGLAYTARKTT